jgi:hypothetical protein
MIVNRNLVTLITIVFLINIAVIFLPVYSCSFGCAVTKPPYLFFIYNQQCISIPIYTLVLVEFLVLILLVAMRKVHGYQIKTMDIGKVLMALGVVMPLLFLVFGYGIGLIFLINGRALYPVYTEGFYGFGYLPVFNNLYEYNPPQGRIWPTPILFVIAGIIFLSGLTVYITRKRF